MFHFLATALQITPHALLQALNSGRMTQTARIAAEVVDAVEASSRESSAIPHLPSQWKWPSLGPTDARRFAPLAVWMQPRFFVEHRLAAGEGSGVSSGTAAAPSPRKTWADVLRNFLNEAIAEQMPYPQVRSRLTASFHRNVHFILISIGTEQGSVKPLWILRLAQELGVPREEAESLIDLWQLYHSNPILSPQEWGKKRKEVRDLLAQRLNQMAANRGKTLSPASLQGFLRGAPAVVTETFHNIVFGTGCDLPHESRLALTRKIFEEAALKKDKSDSIGYWEKFWEGEAKAFGWKTKPTFQSDLFGVHSAMAYATLANWPLVRLERRLEWIISQHPNAVYHLTTFREIFRPAGLKDLRRRRPLDEMMALDQAPESNRKIYFNWITRWEKYAKERNLQAWLRLLPATIQKRKALDSDKEKLEKIFRETAGAPNAVALIHKRLLAERMFDEASMLANLAREVDGVRLPVTRLRFTGTFSGQPATLESNILVLMEELGLSTKPKEAMPHRKAHSAKLGRRFKELELEARKYGWNVEQVVEAIGTDAEVLRYLEERGTAYQEFLAVRLQFAKDRRLDSERRGVIQSVARPHRLDYEVVRVWWDRAALWFDEFPLELEL